MLHVYTNQETLDARAMAYKDTNKASTAYRQRIHMIIKDTRCL